MAFCELLFQISDINEWIRHNVPSAGDYDSDYEFYDIFCIKKALKPDPNKPIGAVFHPEYCYHHMYDDFGTKIK